MPRSRITASLVEAEADLLCAAVDANHSARCCAVLNTLDSSMEVSKDDTEHVAYST